MKPEKELAHDNVNAGITISIPIGKFIDKLFGPAAGEIGLILKDWISLLRLRHFLVVAEKAKKILDERGVEPNQIPLNLLVPLLEKSSLTDEKDIQQKWANLLSNVSDPNIESSVTSATISILSELSPQEAVFLDEIIELTKVNKADLISASWQSQEVQLTEWYEWLMTLQGPQASRIGLLINRKELITIELPCTLVQAQIENLNRLNLIEYQRLSNSKILKLGWLYGARFTQLGKQFVELCSSEE